ncbi:YncE family protein [Pseudaminobacter soli (ex Zhang et al. 2022)]|nr:hypothetical protein [Pseudaminobacter soli]
MAAIAAAMEPRAAQAVEAAPRQLVAKIPLGEVKGRIDHMAVDLPGQRLFVAELGNGSVGIVDLKTFEVSGRIRGFREPQGVGYVDSTGTLYVASAGDGSVRLFRGRNLDQGGRIDLGEDADNIRVDSPNNRVFVGYGAGALAVIDAGENRKIADIALDGHPESFRLESGGSRIFVNVPNAHAIDVADRQRGGVVARWPMGQSRENFPMALDEASGQVLVVFRKPATPAAFSMKDGSLVASARSCGDADDVFVDAKRHRVYVSCGDGHLDVFVLENGNFRRVGRTSTAPGARTSLFVPELDRLFLAVRAGHGDAAIWVYQPTP